MSKKMLMFGLVLLVLASGCIRLFEQSPEEQFCNTMGGTAVFNQESGNMLLYCRIGSTRCELTEYYQSKGEVCKRYSTDSGWSLNQT